MFEGDLTALPTADLLESTADFHAVANRADTRALEAALVYADRYHPSACAGTSAYVTDHGPRAIICRTRASVACARYSRSLSTSTPAR